jgi:hypothetical protein
MLLSDFSALENEAKRKGTSNRPRAQDAQSAYFLTEKLVDFNEFLSNYWYHLPREQIRAIGMQIDRDSVG